MFANIPSNQMPFYLWWLSSSPSLFRNPSPRLCSSILCSMPRRSVRDTPFVGRGLRLYVSRPPSVAIGVGGLISAPADQLVHYEFIRFAPRIAINRHDEFFVFLCFRFKDSFPQLAFLIFYLYVCCCLIRVVYIAFS